MCIRDRYMGINTKSNRDRKRRRSVSERYDFVLDAEGRKVKVGEGHLGELYLVKDKTFGNLYVLRALSKRICKEWSSKESFKKDLKNIKRLKHPNFVELMAYGEKPDEVMIVYEYFRHGTLESYLAKKKKKISEAAAFFFFSQCCLAIHFLHYNNLVHGNFSMRKVLLDERGNSKIIGAGWSDLMRLGVVIKSLEQRKYDRLPPEAFRRETPKQEADVWALGVLLYELIHGFNPFSAEDPDKTKESILNMQIQRWDEGISDTAKDLIMKMMAFDQKARLTIDEIFNHPWMRRHERCFRLRFVDYMTYAYEKRMEISNNSENLLVQEEKVVERKKSQDADSLGIFSKTSSMPIIMEVEDEETRVSRVSQRNTTIADDRYEITANDDLARKDDQVEDVGFFEKVFLALGCVSRYKKQSIGRYQSKAD
eukprot:TRINITY_DN6428_c0_g1_i1.p1 TRINITY_DN6428_c0_g1~~TRINITY_DN6428_c0_g1_i1.p1  ORF type:complete len:425 (-),score=49.19 TRINITY_DN6428_c0_g1_i1:106-1380(-)